MVSITGVSCSTGFMVGKGGGSPQGYVAIYPDAKFIYLLTIDPSYSNTFKEGYKEKCSAAG